MPYVRFGSEADMCDAKGHVRFSPDSGHVRRNYGCPRWAKSGHRERGNASLANAAQRIGMVTLMAGLEIAIHFATDPSITQTLHYLGSDAPPIQLAPLLRV